MKLIVLSILSLFMLTNSHALSDKFRCSIPKIKDSEYSAKFKIQNDNSITVSFNKKEKAMGRCHFDIDFAELNERSVTDTIILELKNGSCASDYNIFDSKLDVRKGGFVKIHASSKKHKDVVYVHIFKKIQPHKCSVEKYNKNAIKKIINDLNS